MVQTASAFGAFAVVFLFLESIGILLDDGLVVGPNLPIQKITGWYGMVMEIAGSCWENMGVPGQILAGIWRTVHAFFWLEI